MSDNPALELAATGIRYEWLPSMLYELMRPTQIDGMVFPAERDQAKQMTLANATKAARAVNALSPLADLLDALDDVGHRESWTVDARYCIACARPWPCPTYAAAERVKAALRGETDE